MLLNAAAGGRRLGLSFQQLLGFEPASLLLVRGWRLAGLASRSSRPLAFWLTPISAPHVFSTTWWLRSSNFAFLGSQFVPAVVKHGRHRCFSRPDTGLTRRYSHSEPGTDAHCLFSITWWLRSLNFGWARVLRARKDTVWDQVLQTAHDGSPPVYVVYVSPRSSARKRSSITCFPGNFVLSKE